MKILFDGCVPRPLRRFLSGHNIHTAQEMGWSRLKNGDLLRAAEIDFAAFITSDKRMKYQQNLVVRKIAILVLPTNDWPVLRAKVGEISLAVNGLSPGDFVELSWD